MDVRSYESLYKCSDLNRLLQHTSQRSKHESGNEGELGSTYARESFETVPEPSISVSDNSTSILFVYMYFLASAYFHKGFSRLRACRLAVACVSG